MTQPTTPRLADHEGAIQRIARALCGNAADADDVAQDLMVAVHTRSAGTPQNWMPWLSGAARRIHWAQGRSEARRRAREKEVARTESQPGAVEHLIDQEVTDRLLALVQSLPAAQSEVMHLRFWEGLPPRAIAARTDATLAAVKTRQKRALAALREKLTAETNGGREAWMSALGGSALVSTHAPITGSGSALALGGCMGLKSVWMAALVVVLGSGWWLASEPSGSDDVEVTPDRMEASATETRPLEEPSSEALLANERGRAPALVQSAPSPPPIPDGVLLISGRVMDIPLGGGRAQAVPAPGLQVGLMAFMMLGSSQDSWPRALTDESGTFRIEHDAADHSPSLTVFVDASESHAAASVELNWEEGDEAPVVVDLYRQAFTSLVGEVVDASGAPIEGVGLALQGAVDSGKSGLEIRSDAEGRFEFPHCSQRGFVAATLPGWTMLQSPSLEVDEAGGWLPVRIVMCRTGSLGVRVVSRNQEPIAGLRFQLDMPPTEVYGSKRNAAWGGFRSTANAITDEDGVAWFPSAWADRHLRLLVNLDGNALRFERELDEHLQYGANGDVGQPIVVRPGTERVLTFEVHTSSTLACLVVDSDGAPFPRAKIGLVTESHGVFEPGFVRFDGQADEGGRCSIRLVSPVPLGPALLTASDDSRYRYRWAPGDSPQAGSLRLDLGRPPTEEVVLTLAPTFAISGRLVDASGQPIRGRVRAAPLDGALVAGRLSTGVSPETTVGKSGEFILAGMPDGHYDLTAGSGGLAEVHLRGVRAGSHGLLLRLEEPRAARVEVHIDSGGVPMDQYVTLVGTHRPGPGVDLDVPLLGRRVTLADPLGWPVEMQGLWYGGGNHRRGGAHTFFSLTPSKEPTKVRELDPGTYWIGAQARGEDGTLFAQMGTGLVRIEEGDYHVTLRMRACVSVGGSLRGEAIPAGLCVSFHLPDGRGVPLDVSLERMSKVVALGAQGTFQLDCVPAGKYELRVGTPAELTAGGALVAQAVELVPGKPAEIVIDL